MMRASLDTNVIIHLYKAGFQELLFTRFEKLMVYEFIRLQELNTHADPEILKSFDKDVESGIIEIITNQYFRDIGMYKIFQSHVDELRILFESSDLGEVYAISVAKTLGCISLVTDDIKERGPHYTLMRMPDSEVMPFAFYELLILDYIEERINKEEFADCFDRINAISGLNWHALAKLKSFIRRFWADPYSDSEKEWMKKFCTDRKLNAKEKLAELKDYLELWSDSQ
jgi:hypothetical protein